MGARLQFRAYTRGSPDLLVTASRTLARVFFASRGRRSAGTAQVSMGTSCEGARLPSDRQARLPALHRGDFGHDHRTFFIGPDALGGPLSRQPLRCPSSDVVQPLKAVP